MILFGSGPSVGRAVACQFASQGFHHIVLASRNASRLEEDKVAVQNAAKDASLRVDTVICDLSDPASVSKALKQIDALVANPEAIIYNGARVAPSPLFETPVGVIENDFKV